METTNENTCNSNVSLDITSNLMSKISPLDKINDLKAVFIVIFFSFICLIPGITSIPPIDREESKYVLISKQFIENNNVLNFEENNKIKTNKSIGTHWIHFVVVKIVGKDLLNSIWLYRLTSFISAIFIALGIFWCARAFTSPPIALLVTLVTLGTLLLAVFARLATPDGMLVASVVIAHGALARVWLSESTHTSSRPVYLFWIMFSTGLLIGGPVGPLVIILTIIGLCVFTKKYNWISKLRPIMGLFVSIAISLPCIVLVNYVTDGVLDIVSIIRDIVGTLGQSDEIVGPIPLTHLLIMQITFWPLSAFAILAIPSIFRNRKKSELIFFLSWAITSWLVFELMPLKLPQYALLILPPIAFLTVIILVQLKVEWRIGQWICAVLIMIVPILLTLSAVILPVLLDDKISITGVLVCSIGILSATIASIIVLKSNKQFIAILPTIITSIILYTSFFGIVLPNFSKININKSLSETILNTTMCEKPIIGSSEYLEHSFKFYMQSEIDILPVQQLVSWLVRPGCKIAIIDKKNLLQFENLIMNLYNKPLKLDNISGYLYASGKHVEYHIYQSNIVNFNTPY